MDIKKDLMEDIVKAQSRARNAENFYDIANDSLSTDRITRTALEEVRYLRREYARLVSLYYEITDEDCVDNESSKNYESV